MSECVKVVLRCRPLNSKETAEGRERIVEMDRRAGQVVLHNPKGDANEPPKTFTFDAVYDWNSDQATIYEETAKPIVDSVMNGYNGEHSANAAAGARSDSAARHTSPARVSCLCGRSNPPCACCPCRHYLRIWSGTPARLPPQPGGLTGQTLTMRTQAHSAEPVRDQVCTATRI